FAFAAPPGNAVVIASPVSGFDPPAITPSAPVPAGGDSTAVAVLYTAYGSVTGLLQDNFYNPVVNATVSAANGQHVLSGGDGRYTLYLPRGPTTVTPGSVPGLVSPVAQSVPAG